MGCIKIFLILALIGLVITYWPVAVALVVLYVVYVLFKDFKLKRNNLPKYKKTKSKEEVIYTIPEENTYTTPKGNNNFISQKETTANTITEEKENTNIISRTINTNDTIFITHMDSYFWDAGRLVIERGKGSIGLLQRELKVGYNRAERIMKELCEAGIVGEEISEDPRKVLINREEFDYLWRNDMIKEKEECQNDMINGKEEYQNENIKNSFQLDRISMYNNKFDYMTGEDFELFIAQMLIKIGFYNIQLTKGSGDQGVDIIAEKDGIKYAFQCKRYDKPVGNKAVQEVFAGKFYYHCHAAIVVTNNYFTQSAKDLAHENGVVLWDRDYIQKFIGIQDNINKYPTDNDVLRKYNENRGSDELRLLDIEEKVVAIEDGQVSRYLYQYVESASRIVIDMYLKSGDGNPYTDDVIKNVEEPIFLYNAKCLKLSKYVLHFTYWCRMNQNYKQTSAYQKTLEVYKNDKSKCKDDLFNISVYYNVEDILFENREVKLKNIPEINIMSDDMETINQLEDIDEYDLQTGEKYLVTENFFPMKMENIKF